MYKAKGKFNKFFLVSTAVALMLLTGCSGMGWSKPGSTEAEFYNDKNDCERQASSVYPVAMGTSGGSYQAPTTTNCTRSGDSVNCISNPGTNTPAPQQDMNAIARLNYSSSCLKGKGYSWSWSR
jgi:hypothetical protein